MSSTTVSNDDVIRSEEADLEIGDQSSRLNDIRRRLRNQELLYEQLILEEELRELAEGGTKSSAQGNVDLSLSFDRSLHRQNLRNLVNTSMSEATSARKVDNSKQVNLQEAEKEGVDASSILKRDGTNEFTAAPTGPANTFYKSSKTNKENVLLELSGDLQRTMNLHSSFENGFVGSVPRRNSGNVLMGNRSPQKLSGDKRIGNSASDIDLLEGCDNLKRLCKFGNRLARNESTAECGTPYNKDRMFNIDTSTQVCADTVCSNSVSTVSSFDFHDSPLHSPLNYSPDTGSPSHNIENQSRAAKNPSPDIGNFSRDLEYSSREFKISTRDREDVPRDDKSVSCDSNGKSREELLKEAKEAVNNWTRIKNEQRTRLARVIEYAQTRKQIEETYFNAQIQLCRAKRSVAKLSRSDTSIMPFLLQNDVINNNLTSSFNSSANFKTEQRQRLSDEGAFQRFVMNNTIAAKSAKSDSRQLLERRVGSLLGYNGSGGVTPVEEPAEIGISSGSNGSLRETGHITENKTVIHEMQSKNVEVPSDDRMAAWNNGDEIDSEQGSSDDEFDDVEEEELMLLCSQSSSGLLSQDELKDSLQEEQAKLEEMFREQKERLRMHRKEMIEGEKRISHWGTEKAELKEENHENICETQIEKDLLPLEDPSNNHTLQYNVQNAISGSSNELKRDMLSDQEDVPSIEHGIRNLQNDTPSLRHEVGNLERDSNGLKDDKPLAEHGLCELPHDADNVIETKRDNVHVRHDIPTADHDLSLVKHGIRLEKNDIQHDMSASQHDVMKRERGINETTHDITLAMDRKFLPIADDRDDIDRMNQLIDELMISDHNASYQVDYIEDSLGQEKASEGDHRVDQDKVMVNVYNADSQAIDVDNVGMCVDTGEINVGSIEVDAAKAGIDIDNVGIRVDDYGMVVENNEVDADNGRIVVENVGIHVRTQTIDVDSNDIDVDNGGIDIDNGGVRISADEINVDNGGIDVDDLGIYAHTDDIHMSNVDSERESKADQNNELAELLKSHNTTFSDWNIPGNDDTDVSLDTDIDLCRGQKIIQNNEKSPFLAVRKGRESSFDNEETFANIKRAENEELHPDSDFAINLNTKDEFVENSESLVRYSGTAGSQAYDDDKDDIIIDLGKNNQTLQSEFSGGMESRNKQNKATFDDEKMTPEMEGLGLDVDFTIDVNQRGPINKDAALENDLISILRRQSDTYSSQDSLDADSDYATETNSEVPGASVAAESTDDVILTCDDGVREEENALHRKGILEEHQRDVNFEGRMTVTDLNV